MSGALRTRPKVMVSPASSSVKNHRPPSSTVSQTPLLSPCHLFRIAAWQLSSSRPRAANCKYSARPALLRLKSQLIMASSDDQMVKPEFNALWAYEGIGSEVKALAVFDKGGHALFVGFGPHFEQSRALTIAFFLH